jgi:cytochrome c
MAKLISFGAGVLPALLASLLPQHAAAQTTPDGATLFKQRCQSCHQIAAGKPSPIGPNFYGVVNRKAAAAPVPFRYSEALKRSRLTWTRANLDRYLASPAKMVPGTRMVVALPNSAHRSAIIAHLARAR